MPDSRRIAVQRLDRVAHWIDLPALVAEAHGLPLWRVDLSELERV